MALQTPQNVGCVVCGYKSTVYKDKSTDRVYCPVCQFALDPDGPIPLDDLSISKFIEIVKKKTVILFWAPWDKKSMEMHTLLSLETRNPRQIAIAASVNIGENPETRRHYGIELLPTILVFSFGREINRVVGSLNSFDLSRLIRDDHF